MNNTAQQVAHHVLAFSNEVEDPITNLKLQKLVYYVFAWYLANTGVALFKETFQAWIHGPVIPSLYNEFKHFSPQHIVHTAQLSETNAYFSEKELQLINEILSVYMPYSAYELELMTHQETPWIEARGECMPTDVCKNTISNDSIETFYKQRIHG